MKYSHLTQEMRNELRRVLDGGEITVDEIRRNVLECLFVENQDYFISGGQPRKIQPETVCGGFMATIGGMAKLYDGTLEGETLYFLDRYEYSHKDR